MGQKPKLQFISDMGNVWRSTFGVWPTANLHGTSLLYAITQNSTAFSKCSERPALLKQLFESRATDLTATDFEEIDIVQQSTPTVDERFGIASCLSGIGTTMISRDVTGQVFTFQRDSILKSWTQVNSFTTDQPSEYTEFGESVSIDFMGIVLVLSSYVTSGDAEVSIYDWHSNTQTWVLRCAFLALGHDSGVRSSKAIAMNSDASYFAMGCYKSDQGAVDAGKVIFRCWDETSNSYVDTTEYIVASNAGATDYFGYSCAMDERATILAVGATGEDTEGGSAGMVYIFTRADEDSPWLETAKITGSNSGEGDTFGRSCALSSDGNILAVGASSEDGTATDSGMVYLFIRYGERWFEFQSIKASDAVASDHFGYACSLDCFGKTLVVGSPDVNTGGVNSGKIYTYSR